MQKQMKKVISLLKYLPAAIVARIDSKLLKSTGHGCGGHCGCVGCGRGVSR